MALHSKRTIQLCSFALSLALISLPLQAGNKHGKGNGPPDWAPAHGYRKNKNKHKSYNDDYHAVVVINAPQHHGTLPCDRSSFSSADIGGVIGGVIGGILGSKIGKGKGNTAATIAGTIIGASIGGSIGASMDEADQYCTGQAFEYAADNQPVQWSNPDTRSQYTVTPKKTYTSSSGNYCREYTSTAVVNNREDTVTGTACRDDQGNWQIIN